MNKMETGDQRRSLIPLTFLVPNKLFFGNSGINGSRVGSYVSFFKDIIISIVWELVTFGVEYI